MAVWDGNLGKHATGDELKVEELGEPVYLVGDYRFLHGDGDGVMEHTLFSKMLLEDELQVVSHLMLDERADSLLDTRTGARVLLEDASCESKYPSQLIFAEELDEQARLFANTENAN